MVLEVHQEAAVPVNEIPHHRAPAICTRWFPGKEDIIFINVTALHVQRGPWCARDSSCCVCNEQICLVKEEGRLTPFAKLQGAGATELGSEKGEEFSSVCEMPDINMNPFVIHETTAGQYNNNNKQQRDVKLAC